MDTKAAAAQLDAIDELAKLAHRHVDTAENIAIHTGALRKLCGVPVAEEPTLDGPAKPSPLRDGAKAVPAKLGNPSE